MNDNERAVLKGYESVEDTIDFDQLEAQLEADLDDSLADLELLKDDKAKIGDPESLGNAVLQVVWDQCINQIGQVAGEDFIKENRGLNLDLSKDAHIQTTENFANGKIATHNTEIDYQKKYDDWQNSFQRNEDGSIKMNKQGKPVLRSDARAPYDANRQKGSKQVNIDEIVPVAEQVRDPAANAHLSLEERVKFDNSEVNLQPLDASANQSKGDRTVTEWLDSERNGQKPAERFNINEEEVRANDAKAREEYEKLKKEGEQRSIDAGKKSRREETFRIGGKVLRAAVMGMLAELIRTIIEKLVAWLKSKEKSLQTFIEQIKEAIKTFIENLKQTLLSAGSVVVNTILTSIYGPIIGTIQKVWILLKQGGKTVKEAIDYIKKPENRKKSFGVLMLEVGKIVTAGLTAMGALALGETIEKILLTVPAFAINIPLLGTLANIIGIFLGAIIAGIAGALVLHLINKLIADKKRKELTCQQIDKGNEVLNKQNQLVAVKQAQINRTKAETNANIRGKHEEAAKIMREAVDFVQKKSVNDNSKKLADMKNTLQGI